ncbi:MAG: transposase [Puniceicoccaceae bacterium]|nr:MAG: transposase [Puniceicoccaceae bacterium]
MRCKRIVVRGDVATYHCMTRTVNGEHLFNVRCREVLRKMIWQVADFSGVRVLTYCVMANHFHVLAEVPPPGPLSDAELMRRYKVLYPKPTRYETASIKVLEGKLAAGGETAEAIRERLLARMHDVSQFMKTLKQRFSIWFNQTHDRFGTLWAERFKSVLVEGRGNPLQTMAAYIDLNPVRAGLVQDPKDYRFCGYAEAVAGKKRAIAGLLRVWGNLLGDDQSAQAILQAHRNLIFGMGADPWSVKGVVIDRETACRVIEQQKGILPKITAMRCRIRYFSDGVILGSEEFVRGFAREVQAARNRKYPMRPHPLGGADWGDVTVLQNLRQDVYS